MVNIELIAEFGAGRQQAVDIGSILRRELRLQTRVMTETHKKSEWKQGKNVQVEYSESSLFIVGTDFEETEAVEEVIPQLKMWLTENARGKVYINFSGAYDHNGNLIDTCGELL